MELKNPKSLFINDWMPKNGLIRFISIFHFALKSKSKLYRTLYKELKGYYIK